MPGRLASWERLCAVGLREVGSSGEEQLTKVVEATAVDGGKSEVRECVQLGCKRWVVAGSNS